MPPNNGTLGGRLCKMLDQQIAGTLCTIPCVSAFHSAAFIVCPGLHDELGMGDNLDLPERECARTPMQWSTEPHAGFTEGAKPSEAVSSTSLVSRWAVGPSVCETPTNAKPPNISAGACFKRF